MESEFNLLDPKSVDFETAITATGFGKFNWMLIAILIMSSCAQLFEQLGISYITPVAQCDLGLTLENKGLLNSMNYAGIVTWFKKMYVYFVFSTLAA